MKSGPSGFQATDTRIRRLRQVLWVVLALNWFVALLKVLLGMWTRCMVIVADGIHSFSDGASNIVGLVGTSIASHPADRDHPYGHRKFETIAALVISFSLFFVAFSIIRESVLHFFGDDRPEVNFLSVSVMTVTLGVNAFTAWWERQKSRELESDLLAADAWHTFSDIFVTLSVFVALAGIHLGVLWLDKVISVAIGIFIGGIAIGILRRSLDVLSDKAVVDEAFVRKLVMAVSGVSDCHEIRSRGRPDDIRIDLHVLVPPRMTVEESHKLANLIEKDLRHGIPGLSDVLVHIEPLHHDHHELEEADGGVSP